MPGARSSAKRIQLHTARVRAENLQRCGAAQRSVLGSGHGESQSPIGPLIASAVAEGYAKRPDGAPTPYRGYYFRVLTRQGKNSAGGPKTYIVGDKMTEGFAFVAYPAEYRSSGVMTFIVNQDGVVYQKDIGWKTDVLAKSHEGIQPQFRLAKG